MDSAMTPLLDIVDADSLLPHEATQKQRLHRILLDLRRRGLLYRPIIVEEKSNVIIDGHHRYEALRILGAKRIPVARAQYGYTVDGITSFTRTVSLNMEPSRALELVEKTIQSSAKKGPSRLVLRVAGLEPVTLTVDTVDFYTSAARLIAELQTRPSQGHVAIVTIRPPPLQPREVIWAARQGIRLAPRSSRHITFLKNLLQPYPVSRLL